MGVLYLFVSDGRVFCPPRYWCVRAVLPSCELADSPRALS
jgi:hypothetical protein